MRLVANFFLTGFLVWIFQQIGWIQIQKDLAPFSESFLNQLLVSGIIGLIFTLGLWIARIIYTIVVIGTAGAGCLLLPVYMLLIGPIGFWFVSKILPGWVVVNASTLQIVVIGLLLAIVRLNTNNSSD